MTIVDREVTALGPASHIFARCRLGHVQNDRHSILIVITLDSLMGVCCVRSDQTVRFRGKLGRLKVLQRVHHFWRAMHVVVNIEHVYGGVLSVCTYA